MAESDAGVRRHTVLAAPTSSWCYDMKAAPHGRKMLLLTVAGTAVIGQLAGETRGYMAWAPLPDRDKVKEQELGI